MKLKIINSYFTDEEIGGKEGMGAFVETDEFKTMNVGFVLDESGPSTTDEFILCYAERVGWSELLVLFQPILFCLLPQKCRT